MASVTKHGDAMRMLDTVQGVPPSDPGENIHRAASELGHRNGKFAQGGVGGMAREGLEAAFDARIIAPPTLGNSTSAAFGAARLPHTGARVTDPWAGTNCIAR